LQQQLTVCCAGQPGVCLRPPEASGHLWPCPVLHQTTDQSLHPLQKHRWAVDSGHLPLSNSQTSASMFNIWIVSHNSSLVPSVITCGRPINWLLAENSSHKCRFYLHLFTLYIYINIWNVQIFEMCNYVNRVFKLDMWSEVWNYDLNTYLFELAYWNA